MEDNDQDDDTTATNPLLESLRAYVDARVDARLAEHGLGDSDSEPDDGNDGNEDDSDSDDEQPSAWGVGPYGDGPYGED